MLYEYIFLLESVTFFALPSQRTALFLTPQKTEIKSNTIMGSYEFPSFSSSGEDEDFSDSLPTSPTSSTDREYEAYFEEQALHQEDFSVEHDYEEIFSEEEYEFEDDFQLQLPINGTIALRRAYDRDENPFNTERQQMSNMCHKIALDCGPLKDVDTTFQHVSWTEPSQHRSRMVRINAGEPVSPKSQPRVEQMTFDELDAAYEFEFKDSKPISPTLKAKVEQMTLDEFDAASGLDAAFGYDKAGEQDVEMDG